MAIVIICGVVVVIVGVVAADEGSEKGVQEA